MNYCNKEYFREINNHLSLGGFDSLDITNWINKYPDDDFLVGIQLKILVSQSKDSLSIDSAIAKAIRVGGTYSLDALGYFYHFKGNSEYAYEHYIKSVQLDTAQENYWVRLDLGYFHEDYYSNQEATPYFEEALAMAPDYPITSFELISNYIKIRQFIDALDILNMVQKNPIFQKYLYYAYELKGDVFVEQRQLNKAEEEYISSIKLNDENLNCKIKLLKLYLFGFHRLKAAEELFDKSIKSHKNTSPEIVYAKSLLLSEKKNFKMLIIY